MSFILCIIFVQIRVRIGDGEGTIVIITLRICGRRTFII